MQSTLRDDALTSTPSGFGLRVGLPWIRSLPIACIRELVVTIDGVSVGPVSIVLGGRRTEVDLLVAEKSWWYIQDRLVLEVDRALEPGEHDVVVDVRASIPYLLAGPGGGPLELPWRIAARLQLDHASVPSVSLDVA